MRRFAMISRLARRRFFLASITVGIAGAACAPPLQNGGVEVRSGAAERLGMVCRWRHGTTSGEGLCAEPQEQLAPSRVTRIAAPTDALAGPLAAGRVGDLLIENGEIAVVIDQLGRGSGFAESGGNIVDAADALTRRDELGQMFTYSASSRARPSTTRSTAASTRRAPRGSRRAATSSTKITSASSPATSSRRASARC
jgi:hypothetical protein